MVRPESSRRVVLAAMLAGLLVPVIATGPANAVDYLSPGVRMRVHASDYTNLSIVITADHRGGGVRVPAGARFSAGMSTFHDIVIAHDLFIDLEPEQTIREAAIGFSVHRRRTAPSDGTPMNLVGGGTGRLTQVLRAGARRFTSRSALPTISRNMTALQRQSLRTWFNDAPTQQAVWFVFGEMTEAELSEAARSLLKL